MIPFDQLRSKFSDILREKVPPKGLEKVWVDADRLGRIQAAQTNKMIIALYNYLEENQIEIGAVTGTFDTPVSVVTDVSESQNLQSTK